MSTANPLGRTVHVAGDDPRVAFRRPSVERRNQRSRERLVERIIAEFREMPCLRLTPAQAQRLFGLRSDISARVIDKLVKDGELRLDPDGRYVKTSRD